MNRPRAATQQRRSRPKMHAEKNRTDLKSLSALKPLQTGESHLDWEQALDNAQVTLKAGEIDLETLKEVFLASASLSKFIIVVRLIYKSGKVHPHREPVSKTLIRFTNDSPFSLTEWIDSIDAFNHWLEVSNRKIDLLPMLHYLDCCAASADARQGGESFVLLLERMLGAFGYIG